MTDRAEELGLSSSADALVAAMARIRASEHSASSADGLVTAVVGGDLRVRSIDVTRDDAPTARTEVAVRQAVNAALGRARRASTEALLQVEGLDDALRNGLTAGQGTDR